MNDPFVGQLTFFRVYSGTLDAGATVLQRDQGQARAHRPPPADARQQARGHQDHRGGQHRRRRRPARDHDRRHAVRREAPDPARAHAVRRAGHLAGDRAEDQGRSGQDGRGAVSGSPSRIRRSACTPTTRPARPSSRGMGELHLEIIVDRLRREFKVEANVGKPQVAYRETITQPVVEDDKYIKQTGGRGQYGHVQLRVEPNERGKGFVFANEIVGGVIPKSSSRPVEKGVARGVRPRRPRRLPDGRRQGRARRRQLPRRRLLGDGLRSRRLAWRSGMARARRAPDPARADHGGRGRHPRRVHRATSSAI